MRLVAVLLALCLSLALVAAAAAAPAPPGDGGNAPYADFAPPMPPCGRYNEQPLAALSPDLAAFLAEREGEVSVAVAIPGQRRVYATPGTSHLRLASVAKVPIMLALLSQARVEQRELTENEAYLLNTMITLSDNAAADSLWGAIGGADGMAAFLDAACVRGMQPDAEGYWGSSTASAHSLAVLLARLFQGRIVDGSRRALALDLLSGIQAYDQWWGVTAGLPDEMPTGGRVGLKVGWYPAEEGWWVNSVGFVEPGNERPVYVLAILTNGQPSFEYGLETVEGVARLVNAQLSGLPARE